MIVFGVLIAAKVTTFQDSAVVELKAITLKFVLRPMRAEQFLTPFYYVVKIGIGSTDNDSIRFLVVFILMLDPFT